MGAISAMEVRLSSQIRLREDTVVGTKATLKVVRTRTEHVLIYS